MRTPSFHFGVLLLALVFTMAGGCESQQVVAKRNLNDQLSERQVAFAQSIESYKAGVAEYEQGGDLEESSNHFLKAVTANDQNAAAWLALGVVQSDRGKYYEAAQAFNQAVLLLPSSYEPHYNLGMLYESVGYYDLAIASYKTALEISPDQLSVIENLARTYIKANRDLPEARKLIARTVGREYREEWREWLKIQALRLDKQLENEEPR